MAQVELQQVTRKYGQAIAIENISFTVPNGEFWVLVGPSGCGKSTILRTIAGLETITSGRLYIDSVLVNEIPARQRDVAMVFQNYALYPHLSVAENLAFGLKMRQVPSKIIQEKVEKIAQSLAISHLLKRRPRQLSGGQQQRVALGRAIVRQPQVFLLDEPLSNLDAQLREQTRAELKQLHQQVGITTVYVTHDQVEAMTLADRIVVLDGGKIQQVGTPQEIYNHPANRMVATFIGSPPMNLLPISCISQATPLTAELRELLKKEPQKTLELGIRPENIHLSPAESSGEGQIKLKVVVETIEPLGDRTLLRANLPDTNHYLNFYVSPNWTGIRGDVITISSNLEDLFLFAMESGTAIKFS